MRPDRPKKGCDVVAEVVRKLLIRRVTIRPAHAEDFGLPRRDRAGQTKGQGSKAFGAGWNVLSRRGKEIESDGRASRQPGAGESPARADSGTGSAAKRGGRSSASWARRNRLSAAIRPRRGNRRVFHIEVAPDNAIDAFYHSYAYAARRENSYRMDRVKATMIDG